MSRKGENIYRRKDSRWEARYIKSHDENGTAKYILSLLRSILKYTSKVCTEIDSRLEIVYPKETRNEMRVLTLNEQQTLKDYLLNDMDNCKFSVYLSMMTGLRIDEICALRWGDISPEKQTLRVGNAMQRLKYLESEPKSKRI